MVLLICGASTVYPYVRYCCRGAVWTLGSPMGVSIEDFLPSLLRERFLSLVACYLADFRGMLGLSWVVSTPSLVIDE